VDGNPDSVQKQDVLRKGNASAEEANINRSKTYYKK
jgi:hypothetical protein